MKALFLCLAILIGVQASATETCYQLSIDGVKWANPAETLCISKLPEGSSSEYRIDLCQGVDRKRIIASFFLNSLPSLSDARSFGPSAARSTIFDDSVTIAVGYGEAYIGNQKYFVREL